MKEHTLAVTVDELKERFSYDPETGEWRYLNPSKFCSIQKGALAGSYRYGHHEIKINGRNYRSNYLVYLYLHGDKIDVNKGKNLFGKMEWTRPVVVEVEIKKTPKQFYEESLQIETDDCVIWPYNRKPDGYARISYYDNEYGTPLVCRIVCTKVYGPAPSDDYQAAHSCNNGSKGCINWKHLSWKTQRDNLIEAGTRKRGTVYNKGREVVGKDLFR